MRNHRNSVRGFTLVELLIVIGIIAVLISILLPVVGKARQSAVSTQCKALLRQYAYASEMYVNDNKGTAVDVHRFLDYHRGLVKYFNQRDQMSPNLARCPGDGDTEAMGRLLEMGGGTDSTFWMYRRDDQRYTANVSIGGNENRLSASLIVGVGGATSARWLKPTQNRGGSDSSRIMTWADFQNNRKMGTRANATVGLGHFENFTAPSAQVNDFMGTVVFRHNGAFNAAFADGHVGEVRTNRKLTGNGHALLPGQDWGTLTHPDPFTGTSVTTRCGAYNSHKTFYPFGPGNWQGKGFVAVGTVDGWDIR